MSMSLLDSARHDDTVTERTALLAAIDAVNRPEPDRWLLRAARERLVARASGATALREAFVLRALRNADPSAADQLTMAVRRTENAMTHLLDVLGGDWYARTSSPRRATADAVDVLTAQLELEAGMGSSFQAALEAALAGAAGRRLPTRPHATLRGRRARKLLGLYASADAVLDVTNARVA
jgi:hypothetical protein